MTAEPEQAESGVRSHPWANVVATLAVLAVSAALIVDAEVDAQNDPLPKPSDSMAATYRVLGVVRADTLLVDLPSGRRRVGLDYAVAPRAPSARHRGQRCWQDALAATRRWVAENPRVVVPIGERDDPVPDHDRSGRLLRPISRAGGYDDGLAQVLLTKGLARPIDRGRLEPPDTRSALTAEAQVAKDQHAGLWGSKCGAP